MKNISQHELRHRMSRVLREVEAGERMRITVAGRAVAELVPITGKRRTFVPKEDLIVPKEDLIALLRRFPLDHNFERDLEAVSATIVQVTAKSGGNSDG